MKISPLLQADFYKMNHYQMYPKGTEFIFANFTPRKSRIKNVNSVVFFGLQYFILEYLVDQWNEAFFSRPKTAVLGEYQEAMDSTLGKGCVGTDHIAQLHDYGRLPLEINAVPEGTIVPIGVPCFTIVNTRSWAGWLVNYIETILSTSIWQATTSATIAHQYRKLLNGYAAETSDMPEFVDWQGHDFSMRGMSSLESAQLSGAGHLLSFTGTDTIPAIPFLHRYYNTTGLVGASVPATEHSVMCAGGIQDEIGTFKMLLDRYPKGILSVVSDTWDLWKVLTEYLPQLKDQIMARDGKLVIRPDSGDPVDIVCGRDIDIFPDLSRASKKFAEALSANQIHGEDAYSIPTVKLVKVGDSFYELTADTDWNRYDKQYYYPEEIKVDAKEVDSQPSYLGVIELLWEVFGGTVNSKGYKQLDSHIGCIYGDSITLERADEICKRLKAKGFASTNVVFGIGSYTYQFNTRDTFGFALKTTSAVVNGKSTALWKDPVTDDGTKKSAKGLLTVIRENNTLVLKDNLDEEEFHRLKTSPENAFKPVFVDGVPTNIQTLDEIKAVLHRS